MSFQSPDLKSIPLFANIPDAHLAQLVAAFDPSTVEAGETIFAEGSVADRFILLVSGEIEVRSGEDRITISPFAPVGELGALAGLHRATTAVATKRSSLLSIPSDKLVAFFEANGDIGFRFHENLMHILADKLERDRCRIEEMRANLVETQKAMKRMREALLDSDDTPLHRTMFEEFDAHIENNRRGRYLVQVPRALPIHVRLDGEHDVLRMSNEKLYAAAGTGSALTQGASFAGVLVSPAGEIPISGTVESVEGSTAILVLDMLIEESAQALERVLARVQLLDVVL